MIFVIDCSLEAVIDQNITASDYSTHTAHKIIFTDGDRHAGTFFQFCPFLLIRRRNINGHLLASGKACGFADFAALENFYIFNSAERFKRNFILICTYASEADILNMALFGKTAAQWRTEKGIKGKTPNIRDFASAEELVVLINLEDTNADLIRQEVPKIERLKILREKAYRQLELLKKNQDKIDALKNNLIKDIETN